MTDVSLKEHLESQIKWVDRHFASQIITIQEKTRDAKEQIDKRLEGMNEFRDTLKDQAGRLATRSEVDAAMTGHDQRIKMLELRDARIAGMAAVVALLVSGAVAFIARFL
jgi:hypothetical protein